MSWQIPLKMMNSASDVCAYWTSWASGSQVRKTAFDASTHDGLVMVSADAHALGVDELACHERGTPLSRGHRRNRTQEALMEVEVDS